MPADEETPLNDGTALVRRSAFIARQTRDLAKRVEARSLIRANTEVVFPDKNLEAAIREALGKAEGQITIDDVKGLAEFDAEDRNIENPSGLEALTNLTWLELSDNQIQDIAPLEAPTQQTRPPLCYVHGTVMVIVLHQKYNFPYYRYNRYPDADSFMRRN
jgi:Leucine-rich repeat (LRR) protein